MHKKFVLTCKLQVAPLSPRNDSLDLKSEGIQICNTAVADSWWWVAPKLAARKITDFRTWNSHGHKYDDYCRLEHEAVQSGRNLSTRREKPSSACWGWRKRGTTRQKQVPSERWNFLRYSNTSHSRMLLSQVGLKIRLKFALAKCGRYIKFWQKDIKMKGTFWDKHVWVLS